ncbi:MAG: NACHT domain-containing protein [Saprospiraceae bacterium]
MSAEVQVSIEFAVSVLQKIIESSYDFLVREKQKRDLFGKSAEAYAKGLVERFGEVKVLGMSKPVPLLSLYVRANILEKISTKAGFKLEDLEQFFEFDKRTFGVKIETRDGEEIANELQRFIVLGKPGAGKTTFLKYLALAMVHKQSVIKHRRLPIFVTLRDWADKKCSLQDYIVDQFKICGFDQSAPFVDNLLKKGECLVLLDGLDEVSQEANLDSIIRDIRDFTDRYSDNQFVMSCRIAAYNHWFGRFTDVEMADFNEKQIENFVRNWFRSEPKTGKEMYRAFEKQPAT